MIKDHHWYAGGVGALFGAITLVVALFLLMYWGAIKTALTPRPENFTELFFEKHLELPKIIKQGQVNSFAFTIHNVEYKTMTYPIEVSYEDEVATGSSNILERSQVTLAHDESKTIPVSYIIPTSVQTRDKITVKLVNLDQTIHFWVQSDPPVGTPSAMPISQATSSAKSTAPASATPAAILQAL